MAGLFLFKNCVFSLSCEDVAKRLGKVKEERIETRITGFNSILAVASIEAAKRYYLEFKLQQQELPANQR